MADGGMFIGYDVLKTSVDEKTKCVSAMLGHMNGEGATERENAEWWQHTGLITIPAEMDKAGKNAAKTVIYQTGGYDIVIASRDPRGLELAGTMGPGDACLYSPGKDGKGQARVLVKSNGSVTLMGRKGNVAGGKGMMVQLDAENGAIRMLNDLGFAIIIDADGITLTAKKASLTLKASGDVSLVGTGQTQVDGGGILLGNLGIPGINSALAGPTGLVGVASAKVIIQLFILMLFFGALVQRS